MAEEDSLRLLFDFPTQFLPTFARISGSPLSSPVIEFEPHKPRLRRYGCVQRAVSIETSECRDEPVTPNLTLEPPEDSLKDTVEELLSNKDDISKLMKMERRPEFDIGGQIGNPKRWFPYLDEFKVGRVVLSSGEVLEAMDPYILEARKARFRKVANNRSYAVCLVVEGLSDFGNVSAAFRSADALGFQSVHVVSCDSSKRYRDNRHVSMGAEKWLDIELWDSTQDCFKILKSRGYRIATTHVGIDAVSIYDMDWSFPTAIVVGNETRGISEEALELSDLHCSIPMNGMVDSFNVSVAAGILMHHAVSDRTTRLGCHGDLTLEENQILLAEFSLRHSKSAISIAHEYARRKAWPKL
ncbi:tRNA/rRNA methyltransferase (SpoU) family protein [Actinidia rufa]|uniref:tRNA/rRNA methyltransferase (SpoU) family protein n=1 Tax=Actinidia rufa TaxID=165716 RepID=A0A7J0H839_9ERIC|nr:tRNA/rRNA methyltransferase (SpoU) family protein [Actinidia rufa]